MILLEKLLPVIVFVLLSFCVTEHFCKDKDSFEKRKNVPLLTSKSKIADITTLPTCCSYQNQFSEDADKCSLFPPINALTFDDNLNLPAYLLSYAYRNQTRLQNIKFRLREETLACPDGTFAMSLDMNDNKELNDPTYLISLTIDGHLQIGIDYYSPKEYCIDSINNNKVSFVACKPTCDEKRPCIPKCCDLGQVWEFGESHIPHCGNGDENRKTWEPALYADRYTKMDRAKQSELAPHYVLHHPGSGYCDYGHPFLISLKAVQEGLSGIVFRILKDGSIITRVRRRQWSYLPRGDYCVDGIKNPFQGSSALASVDEEQDTIILYCHKDIETSEGTISKVYGVSMIISSMFLILTLIVFGLLWEKYRHNIQRWTIFLYVAALLLMYFFFILSYFSNFFDGETVTNMGMCRFIGIGMHITFLMNFCFLSCINFEIWWTVRAFATPTKYFHGFMRLFSYIVFAICVPLIVVSVGLILEAIYDSDLNSEVIIPEYGRFTCNLGSRDAFWAYMYGPVGFLLFCNVAFFVTTAYQMWKILQVAKADSNVTVKHHRQSDLVSRFGKLYIIQGVPWIFELVSFAAHEDEFRWYWILFDLINIFQSVAIFVIFVCNRETVFALQSKYPILKKVLSPIISKGNSRNQLDEPREEDSGKLSTVEIGPTFPKENIEMNANRNNEI